MKRREFLLNSGGFAACVPTVGWADTLLVPKLEAFQSKMKHGAFRIRDLYNRDQSFSDLALACEGQRVTFRGYMAPPIKEELAFFVLTNIPMAVCPFCEPDLDWPNDILPIYTNRIVWPLPFNVRITATGVFETGAFTDEETGFYSLARLVDATYREG
ncbi:hypothetical protein [Shimia thalassica]|uniref:hypothetical protein n=1 Tax=Shimia thalassica TaxID=1715693 RepID=UPI0027339BE2|nr:hypothetical protein [Shimia thalassica]MDP2520060.1 hypothetical protein [Shimia thalassica]